jgi:cyclopropane-fatty-acyl-phospholipid synthase
MQYQNPVLPTGASAEDIQFHYDLNRDFYRLWLDETMTYSCAMFEDGDDLNSAQLRKLDYHIAQTGIIQNNRILDIGCGWGSLMQRVTTTIAGTQAVGLTLSVDQKDYIDRSGNAHINTHLKS